MTKFNLALSVILTVTARARALDVIDPTGTVYVNVTDSGDFSSSFIGANLFDTDVTGMAVGTLLTGGDWAEIGTAPAYIAFQVDHVYNVGSIYYAQRVGADPTLDKITRMSLWASSTTPFAAADPGVAPDSIIPVPQAPGGIWAEYLMTNIIVGQYFLAKLEQVPAFGGNIGGKELRLGSALPDGPPWIVTQPASKVVVAGDSVTFTAAALGAAPLAYQWQFDSTNVPGATATSFTLTNVSLAASGSVCSVIVSSVQSNATSSNAWLSVFPAAATYDAVADFSTNSNPNGVWSYRYRPGTLRDGNYPLLPGFGPASGNFAPNDPGSWTVNGYVPAVGVNDTGSDVAYSGVGFVWPDNSMLVHPGNLDLVVLSWQSPSTLSLDISFSFTALDSNGGNGIAWYVEENDSSNTLASGVYPLGGASGPQTLSAIRVNAGDSINFVVDPNGDYGYDSTQLTATISTRVLTIVGPPLQISQSGHLALVFWSTNSAGFNLETSAILGPNQNWARYPGSILVLGGQNVVVADTTTGPQFFRLHKQ